MASGEVKVGVNLTIDGSGLLNATDNNTTYSGADFIQNQTGSTQSGGFNISGNALIGGRLIRHYPSTRQYSLGGVFQVNSAILADSATRQRLPVFISNTSFDETGKTQGLIRVRTDSRGSASDTDNPWINGYRATKLLCEILTEHAAGHMCNEEEIRRSDELGIGTGSASYISGAYGLDPESHMYGITPSPLAPKTKKPSELNARRAESFGSGGRI